tara:strand:- start:1583 stop:2131 length:549 start_codon:yes stop_codon:yes gene_type:complete
MKKYIIAIIGFCFIIGSCKKKETTRSLFDPVLDNYIKTQKDDTPLMILNGNAIYVKEFIVTGTYTDSSVNNGNCNFILTGTNNSTSIEVRPYDDDQFFYLTNSGLIKVTNSNGERQQFNTTIEGGKFVLKRKERDDFLNFLNQGNTYSFYMECTTNFNGNNDLSNEIKVPEVTYKYNFEFTF